MCQGAQSRKVDGPPGSFGQPLWDLTMRECRSSVLWKLLEWMILVATEGMAQGSEKTSGPCSTWSLRGCGTL